MTKSDNISKLAAALVAAHKTIGGAVKDGTNPHFKSSFATLESVIDACKSALNEQGIAVTQLVTAEGLETVLLHSSGEFIASTMPIVCAKQNDPQATGSALTYARRYALQSAMLIPAVDDDGEAATHRAPAKAEKPLPVKPRPAPEKPKPSEGEGVITDAVDSCEEVVAGDKTFWRVTFTNTKRTAVTTNIVFAQQCEAMVTAAEVADFTLAESKKKTGTFIIDAIANVRALF